MAENESAYIVSEATTIVDEVNFIEINAEEILNRLLGRFEYYTREKLYPADERRIFLHGLAYVLAEESVHINETGRGNLLQYATGNQLDALGQLYGSKRLAAGYATTVLQVTISNSAAADIIIPKGLRVTPDGEHFFAMDNYLVYTANTAELTQTVTATAVEPGTAYNDFAAGQIVNLVDTSPYIQEITNITASTGGTDMEDDESYRERLQISPFEFSVAGPAEAYRSIALGTSTEVGDAYVYSSVPGQVDIIIVKEGGVIPDADDPLLTDVYNACSDRNARPLTDYVVVSPASAVDIEINVKWYDKNGDLSVSNKIMEAVSEYTTWQTEKIARDINPDYLHNLLMNAGAGMVEVISPQYQALDNMQIANVTGTAVSYAGSVTQ